MLEDGTPPPEALTIERVCNGVPHAEAYTDTKGYFSFQLGQDNGAMQDASESGMGGSDGLPGRTMDGLGRPSTSMQGSGLSRTSMGSDLRFSNCDIRARLAGFRSQEVSLVNRRALDNPDIGTILLHRTAPSEGSIVSAVSLAAPKDARKAYEKGLEGLKKNKTDVAARNFEKAVEAYPNYAAAWFELGKLQAAAGDFFTARGSFGYAVKADPKFVGPYLELSLLALHDEKWQDLADITDSAVRLDPFDYPQAFLFNGLAKYNLKRIDDAEKSVREALRLDTRRRYPETAHLMGLIMLRHRDYSGAAEQFRTYLQLAPTASDAEVVRSQLTAIEKVSAQNVPPKENRDQ